MKRSWKRNRSRALRRDPQKFTQHAADVLEPRVLLSATTAAPAAKTPPTTASSVEPINGAGNNVANPTWGTAGTDLIRLTPAQYANGIDSPSLPQDPSARLISNIVNNQADPANPSQDIATVNQQSLSDFAYSFGQFMDHDMDLTLDNGASDPISVPAGDPIGGAERRSAGVQSVSDRSHHRHEHQQSGPGCQRHHLVPRSVAGLRLRPGDRQRPADLRRRPDEDQSRRPAAARQHHLFHRGTIGRHQRLRRRHGGPRAVAPIRTCSSPATAAATRTSS